jgi:hypothetical protein
MSGDELSAPLGQETGAKRRRRRIGLLRVALAGTGTLGLALAPAVWAVTTRYPVGGTPVGIAPFTPILSSSASRPEASRANDPVAGEPRNPAAQSSVETTGAIAPPGRTITIIDGTSGQRREIVIPDAAGLDDPPSGTPRRGAGIRIDPSALGSSPARR